MLRFVPNNLTNFIIQTLRVKFRRIHYTTTCIVFTSSLLQIIRTIVVDPFPSNLSSGPGFKQGQERRLVVFLREETSLLRKG